MNIIQAYYWQLQPILLQVGFEPSNMALLLSLINGTIVGIILGDPLLGMLAGAQLTSLTSAGFLLGEQCRPISGLQVFMAQLLPF